MTLTYYDKFAFIPTRCFYCNRLFWLEGYNYPEMDICTSIAPIIKNKCKECIKKKNKKEKAYHRIDFNFKI